jgi:hypothetical protein
MDFCEYRNRARLRELKPRFEIPLAKADAPVEPKERRVCRHRVNLGTDIQNPAKNRCDATKNRCPNNRLFQLDLRRVDISI